MASYTRLIPPGGEGKVNVTVNTSGYGGRKISKNIVLHTNETNNPRLTLTILGSVELFATITPRYVRLAGIAGQAIEGTVRIVPTEKYAFKILGARAKNGEHIHYTVKPQNPGGGYLLTVENRLQAKGRYSDMIYLETDSPIQPEIKISLYGNIIEKE